MNRLLLLALAFLALNATLTQAQNSIEYSTGQQVRIYSPGFTPYKGVEGTPYIPSDTARPGWLVNGPKQIPAQLRYNTYTNEVEYVEGDRISTPANSITGFAILAPDTMYFRRGFPAVASRVSSNFYQILYNGRKNKLLRYVFSDIRSNTEVMNDDFGKKRFQKREEYYVWTSTTVSPAENYFEKVLEGTMKPVLLNKKSLISLFPKQATFIDQYLAEQKMKLKTWTEFASVLRHLE